MRPPAAPNDAVVVGSVHVSTKNLTGHDHPQPNSAQQDDFPGRLPFKSRIPGFGAHVRDWLTPIAEHVRQVSPDLLVYERQRFYIEWNRYRLPRFRLVRVNPRQTPQ